MEEIKTRTCMVCKIDLTGSRKDKKICSPTCNQKYLNRKKQNRPISNIEFHKSLIIKCIICGNEVQAYNNTKKICSPECRDKYSQRKKYNLPLSNLEYNKLLNKKCEWCGIEYKAGQAFGKTCSNKCATALYRRIKRKPIINKWTLQKRKNDISYKILGNLRTRLYYAIIKSGAKKNNSILKLTGCSKEILIKHLKDTSDLNFSWNIFNNGNWAIDHIIPCDIFNMFLVEDQYKCFNYKNLRIITKIENLKKSNKFDINLIKQYKIEHLLPEGFIC